MPISRRSLTICSLNRWPKILFAHSHVTMPPDQDIQPQMIGKESCSATMGFDEAVAILRLEASPLGTERVACTKAGRRVLAEPVHARIDAPRQRVSAMDGYAIRQDDLDAGTRRYLASGSSFAGGSEHTATTPGEALYVATGATVPGDAARVVPVELTKPDGPYINLTDALPDRTHLREPGSDFSAGDLLVSAGRLIDPRALLAIAAGDVAEVMVWRRPRVRVVTTGDELVAPGAAAATQRSVPDSLGEALLLFTRQWGGSPDTAARVPDDQDTILATMKDALAGADLVLLVGGASRGRRDFSKAALAALGMDMKFDSIAMKPGRPVWYARVGEAHVIGLPGNPTAAMTVARLLVAPLVAALGGRGISSALEWQTIAVALPIAANGPREAFLCGERSADGVAVLERQAASAQMLLARADMLVRRAPNALELPAGARVQALKF